MENHEAMNQSNMMNYLGMMNSMLNKPMMPQQMMPQQMMPQQMMNQPMMTQPVMAQPMMPQPSTVQSARMAYPEVYYKLQPHVMMVCDQMDAYGMMMPTQEMVEQMTDHIYNDVNRMHPDLAEYVEKKAKSDEVRETVALPFGMYDRDRDRERDRDRDHSFRRRGPFRDLIEILLLQELFNRRRRRY